MAFCFEGCDELNPHRPPLLPARRDVESAARDVVVVCVRTVCGSQPGTKRGGLWVG